MWEAGLKIFQRTINASRFIKGSKSVRGGEDVGQGGSASEVNGLGGCGWMPQKSSKYPPIHDHIDTLTDFIMAVRKWRQRSRSRGEAEQAAEKRWKVHNDKTIELNTGHGRQVTCEWCKTEHTETDAWWERWLLWAVMNQQRVCDETGWIDAGVYLLMDILS